MKNLSAVTIRRARAFMLAGLAAFAGGPASAKTCAVVDGAIAEVAPGPFLPNDATVTLKRTYKAEFRWDPLDKEAVGWMRILDETGQQIGWVPAGHEAVRCGGGD